MPSAPCRPVPVRRCDSAGPAWVHPSPGSARSRLALSVNVRAVPLSDGTGPLASMFAALKVSDLTCSTFPLAHHGLNSSLTLVGSHRGSTLRSCAEGRQRNAKQDRFLGGDGEGTSPTGGRPRSRRAAARGALTLNHGWGAGRRQCRGE